MLFTGEAAIETDGLNHHYPESRRLNMCSQSTPTNLLTRKAVTLQNNLCAKTISYYLHLCTVVFVKFHTKVSVQNVNIISFATSYWSS